MGVVDSVSDMSDRVVWTVEDGVADVRLNRPEKMNALDPAMFSAIVDVGEQLQRDPKVRAVVLSGEGRAFCAGLDFGSFQAMAGGPRSGVEAISDIADGRITHQGQQCAYVWQELEVPVIAAIHGVALGGGCQIALGADIRLCTADAQFSVLEIRWGLVPDMTGSQLLPMLVGLDKAKELTFTGRMVSGEEAASIGLATRVSANPLEDALTMARDIAAKNPHAIRGSKTLLNLSGRVSLAEGFAAERSIIGGLIGSPNQKEAVTAFFEKRAATYADFLPN